MPKKILFTASNYTHVRHFHLPYFQHFQDLGFTVHLACAAPPDTVPYVDAVWDIPFRKSLTAPENALACAKLRRLIRKEGYDLITTHTSLAACFTRLAVKGLYHRPKLVNMMHGYLFDDDTPAPKRQLLYAAERLTAPETDLLLTMNTSDTQLARRAHFARRIVQIPGIGVDFHALDHATSLRQSLPIPPGSFVYIYAAEFSARKSQAVLIRALRHLPEDTVLLLPGDGALLSDCQALAREYNLQERVLFPGMVSNMPQWYASADAAISASRSEGLPFNILEAMYARLPVIASAVKGHTDLIRDGETGLLYPYGDVRACARAMRRIRSSPALRETLAQNALSTLGPYQLDHVLPRVCALYLSVLS